MSSKYQNRYSDEDLIAELLKVKEELGRVPNALDFQKRIPNEATFRLRFGSWNNVLKVAGLKKTKHKLTDYTKDELISYLHKYYNEYGKVPTTRDLNKNKKYPCAETFRNAFGNHKDALMEAGLYELRKDKEMFSRRTYTREEIIELVRNFIEENNRLPTSNDFNGKNKYMHLTTIRSHFNNLHEVLSILGYESDYKPIRIFSNEELLSLLHALYLDLGKTPTADDIDNCDYTSGYNVYSSRFGSLYNALKLANIPFQKRGKYFTNEEIISVWIEVKNKLNHIPTIHEMREHSTNIIDSIITRWGTYTDFVSFMGEESNYNKYGCRVYFTNNGTRCYSVSELKITQFLEDNKINFEKDYPYSKIITNDTTKRTLDWKIDMNNEIYYVELFGIERSNYYDTKREKKIQDFKNSGLKLIELYHSDVYRKDPLETLGFLFSDNVLL